MNEHLESGCASCRRVLASLRAVERSGLEAGGGELVPDRPAREVMELVWDSARAPLQLADAGPAESGRQLNYATNEFELSARLEDVDGSEMSVLVARLRSKFRAPVADLAVKLLAAGDRVETVNTGDLGHFELPLAGSGPIELVIAVEGGRELVAHLETSG